MIPQLTSLEGINTNRTMTDKARDELDKAERNAWARAEAWTIVCPATKKFGLIKVVIPLSLAGIVKVWVWDFTGYCGHAQASGYGYDKLSECLSKIVFNGEVMEKKAGSDLWQTRLQDRGYMVIRAL